MKVKFIVIGAVTAVVIGAGIPVGIKLFGNKTKPNEQAVKAETPVLPRPSDGTTPLDYDILENVYIAAGVIKDEKKFKAVSEGHAITNMVITNDQFVHAERRVDGDYYMKDTYTSSSFVKIASQKYYTPNRVYLRDGKLTSTTTAEWKDNCDPVTYEYIDEVVGVRPNLLCAYVINETSVNLAESYVDTTNTEFDYVVHLSLDLEESVVQSKREVKYNSSAADYPKYSEVSCTIAMDKNWRVQQIISHDVYKIQINGLPTAAPVDSLLTENFYYDDYQIDEATKEFYKGFEDVDINDNPNKDKTGMEYLQEVGLGVVLGGSTLDADIQFGAYSLKGKVYLKFDLMTAEIKATALFDDLYLSYNKDLYVSYKKYNYKLNEGFISDLFKTLGIDIANLAGSIGGGDSSGMDDMLGDVIANKDADGNVVVTTEIAVGEEKLTLTMNIIDKNGSSTLQSISLDGMVLGEKVAIKVTPASSSISSPGVSYVDLSDASWMIDHITSMVSYTGYMFDVDYHYGDYDVNINAVLDSDKNIKVTATLDNKKVEPILVEIYYYEDQAYVVYGNIGIQISHENIQDVIALITSYLELDQSSSIDIEDMSSILSTVYDVFEGIEIGENKEVRISLALSNLYSSLKDVELTVSEKDDALLIGCNEYNLKLAVSSYDDGVVVPAMTFITVDEFVNFFDGVKSLVESSEHAIDIHNLTFKYGEFDLNLSGSANFSKDKADVQLSVRGDVIVDLSLIYDQKEYYLSITNEVTAIYLKASQEQMAKLISDLKAGLYQLSKDEELNLLIKKLLNDANIDLDKKGVAPGIIIEAILDVLTYVKGSSLTLVDNKLDFVGADNLTIGITKDEDSYKLDLSNFDYLGLSLNTSLSISNNVTFTSVSNPDSFVSIDKVLAAIDDIILELGKLHLSVEEVASYIEAISNFEGYIIEADFDYRDYDIKLVAAIDSEGDIKLDVFVTNSKGEAISLAVVRKDSVFYLTYGEIAFELTDTDIMDIAVAIEKLMNKEGTTPSKGDTIINGQTIDLASIITMVFDVYRGIEVNDDNSVSISLALSVLLPELGDIVINVKIVDNIVYGVVKADEQVITIKMSEYIEDIIVDETLTYLDRADFEFVCGLVDEISTIIKNKEDIKLSIDDMVITYQGVSYIINGKVYYSVDKASLDLSVVSEGLNLKLSMILVDNEVYISVIYNESEPINVHGSKANMIDLITYIYDNDQLLGQLIPSISYDMTSTLATIFSVLTYLKDATITVSENGIALVVTDIFDIQLNKVESTYTAIISAITTDLTIAGSVSLVKEAQVIVAPEASVDIDPTIDIVFQVVQELVKNNISLDDCLELYNTLVGYQGYEIKIDSLYAMGFTINGNAYVDSKNNVSLDLVVIYATNTINIRIEMFENEYFLYWSNYCFNLTQQDLADVLNFITSNSNVTATSFDLAVILDKISAVFQGLTINNGELNLSLAISKLYSELPDLTFTSSFKDKLTFISSDDYKLNISISEYTGLVEHRSVAGLNYMNRTQYDKFFSYFNDVFNEVKDGAFRLDFKNVNIHMVGNTPEAAGTDLTINGYIEIFMLPADKVTFKAQLIITGAVNYYIGATFGEDQLLYLQITSKYDAETVTPLTDGTMLKFTRNDMIQIFTNVLNGIDEDTEIGKRLSTFAGVNIVKSIFLQLNILDENMTEIKGEGMSLDAIVKNVYKALAVIQDSRMTIQDNYINVAKADDKMDVDISLNYNPLDTLYTVIIKKFTLDGTNVNGAITISSHNEVCNVDNPEKYTDMGGLPALSEALFNSIENMQFHISGNVILDLKIIGLSLMKGNIGFEGRVAYVDDAIQGYIYMNIERIPIAMDSFNSLENYIYIDNDIIYMKRVKKYTQWFQEKTETLYRKSTLAGFGKNMLGENGHLDFLFSFTNIVTNAMTSSSMNFTLVSEELFGGYSYNSETGVYSLILDLPNGLTTDLFSELNMSIGTATYPTLQGDGTFKDELYLRSFKGNISVFSMMHISFDFVENGCFGTLVDMSVVPTNLAEDTNYSFYNE